MVNSTMYGVGIKSEIWLYECPVGKKFYFRYNTRRHQSELRHVRICVRTGMGSDSHQSGQMVSTVRAGKVWPRERFHQKSLASVASKKDNEENRDLLGIEDITIRYRDQFTRLMERRRLEESTLCVEDQVLNYHRR